MQNRALIINAEIEDKIAAAVAKAREHPTPLEVVKALAATVSQGPVMKLEDREPGYQSPAHRETVDIPRGYRAAISFEYQPIGLCYHLSVSVDTPGNLPSREAVKMIAKEFGLAVPFDSRDDTMVWVEEFDPGHSAVNIVQRAKSEH